MLKNIEYRRIKIWIRMQEIIYHCDECNILLALIQSSNCIILHAEEAPVWLMFFFHLMHDSRIDSQSSCPVATTHINCELKTEILSHKSYISSSRIDCSAYMERLNHVITLDGRGSTNVCWKYEEPPTNTTFLNIVCTLTILSYGSLIHYKVLEAWHSSY